MPHDLADRRRLLGLALLVGLLLGVGLRAPAQTAENDGRHFFSEKQFEIPLTLNNTRNVRQVTLHVSTDEGKTFAPVGTAGPDAKKFTYTAKGDGWHFFVVQAEDYQGRKSPAAVDRSAVSLEVCIDTEKPEVVKFNAVAPQEGTGTVAVEWEAKDNRQLLPGKLRLDYRPAKGGKWTALNVLRINPGQFSWSPPAQGDYEVRLLVYDAAGNSAEKKTTVTARTAGGPAPEGPPPETPNTPRVHHVKSKTFKLEYKIDNVGPSSVKNVEVWMTRDLKQWSLFRDDAPADPSAKGGHELTVTAAGRWGFTLRPISGVGRAGRAPQPNEQPQIWIMVDETPPVVKILDVKVGEGAEDGTITVTYQATDAWMRKEAISISYAESKDAKDGDWVLIESKLPNTGSAKFKKDKVKPFEFYLRVEAIDEAGHVGRDQTKDSVKVDTNEPKATITNVIGVSVRQEP